MSKNKHNLKRTIQYRSAVGAKALRLQIKRHHTLFLEEICDLIEDIYEGEQKS